MATLDDFSWSDTARAVLGSCLPCFSFSPKSADPDEDPGARRDELESLLQSAEFSDAEMDADALSLHSQIGAQDGRRRVKKKRGRNKGSIRLFGYDLFGRPLQTQDTEVEGENDRNRDARRISRISSSTLDSDAAPLADDAIAQLSTQTRARSEADAARKARKEKRKEQKKAIAAALLNAQPQRDDFEGFPGSGGRDDFGAFQQAPSCSPAPVHSDQSNHINDGFFKVQGGGPDEEDAEADFDAGSYVRSAPPRSDSGSGTRSRTSASASQSQPQSQSQSQTLIYTQDPSRIPLPPSSAGSPKPKSKRSKKSGKRSATTVSSSSSQPRSPTVPSHFPRVDIASPTWGRYPNGAEFEGVPHDDEFSPVTTSQPTPGELKLTGQTVHGDMEDGFVSPGVISGFPSPGLGRASGFPSTGFGGRKNSLIQSGTGAFLARTGADS